MIRKLLKELARGIAEYWPFYFGIFLLGTVIYPVNYQLNEIKTELRAIADKLESLNKEEGCHTQIESYKL